MTNTTTAANDTRKPVTAATVTVWEIRSKDLTRSGVVHPGTVTKDHHAQITPGVSIRLFGLVAAGARYVRNEAGRQVPCEEHPYCREFSVGDTAQVGSYNVDYTGTITAITEKTVTVVEYHGTRNAKTHRLALCDFDRMNWDFDATESAKRNVAWSD